MISRPKLWRLLTEFKARSLSRSFYGCEWREIIDYEEACCWRGATRFVRAYGAPGTWGGRFCAAHVQPVANVYYDGSAEKVYITHYFDGVNSEFGEKNSLSHELEPPILIPRKIIL